MKVSDRNRIVSEQVEQVLDHIEEHKSVNIGYAVYELLAQELYDERGVNHVLIARHHADVSQKEFSSYCYTRKRDDADRTQELEDAESAGYKGYQQMRHAARVVVLRELVVNFHKYAEYFDAEAKEELSNYLDALSRSGVGARV